MVLLALAAPKGVIAQIVRPEAVFPRDKIAARGISAAKIVTKGRLSKTETEYYYFDTTGRLTGIVTVLTDGTDILLSREVTDGRVTSQQELRQGGQRREELHYDESSRVVLKLIRVDDTLFSTVMLEYNADGMLVESVELSVNFDTLRTATYHYSGGVLSHIDYRGTAVGRIEFYRLMEWRVTRVFDTEGQLMLTRMAQYREDRLLLRETVVVPGITAGATTTYRYRLGLLRAIIHPDGRRSRVRYGNQVTF
jgi:hypothetical protein